MRVFAKLRAVADFRRRNLPEIRTAQDEDLVREIGYHQVLGAPLTLKQLMLLGIGSSATTERRLRRLKRLGVVRGRRSPVDGRVVELTLSASCMRAYSRFDALLAQAGPLPRPSRDAARQGHGCCLCQGEAEALDAVLGFFGGAAARHAVCVLIGPASFVGKVHETFSSGDLAKRATTLVSSTGHDDPRATVQFLATRFTRAHSEARSLRLAIHSGWVHERKLPFEALLRVEDELQPLVRAHGGEVLCVFDVHRFAGPRLVELLRAHAVGNRVPVQLA